MELMNYARIGCVVDITHKRKKKEYKIIIIKNVIM